MKLCCVLGLGLLALASGEEAAQEKAAEMASVLSAASELSDGELVGELCAAHPGLRLCGLQREIDAAFREVRDLLQGVGEAQAQPEGEGEGPVEEEEAVAKRKSPFLRFGKRKSPFLRFGKRSGQEEEVQKRKSPFLRFGKRKSPFLRF